MLTASLLTRRLMTGGALLRSGVNDWGPGDDEGDLVAHPRHCVVQPPEVSEQSSGRVRRHDAPPDLVAHRDNRARPRQWRPGRRRSATPRPTAPSAAPCHRAHASVWSRTSVSHRVRQSMRRRSPGGGQCRDPATRWSPSSASRTVAWRDDAPTRSPTPGRPDARPPVARYVTSGASAVSPSAWLTCRDRAPPSTQHPRRGWSTGCAGQPAVITVPSGTTRPPRAPSVWSSSGLGGLWWPRCTAMTSVWSVTAPRRAGQPGPSGNVPGRGDRPWSVGSPNVSSIRTMSNCRPPRAVRVGAGSSPVSVGVEQPRVMVVRCRRAEPGRVCPCVVRRQGADAVARRRPGDSARDDGRNRTGSSGRAPVAARVQCCGRTHDVQRLGATGPVRNSSAAGPTWSGWAWVNSSVRTPSSRWPCRAAARGISGPQSRSMTRSTKAPVCPRTSPRRRASPHEAQLQNGFGQPSAAPVPRRTTSISVTGRWVRLGGRPVTGVVERRCPGERAAPVSATQLPAGRPTTAISTALPMARGHVEARAR